MNNIAQIGSDDVARLLSALGEQLQADGERCGLVIVGGSALIAKRLVSRVTRDIDVIAMHRDGELLPAETLPAGLVRAARRVAADFGLPEDWLSSGPAPLLRWGLPDGFLARAERREFGPALDVLLASRFDQIHLKLYAVVDQGAGRHLQDLRSLEPSKEELLSAARWCITHDPSEGFGEALGQVLAYLGVHNVP